MENPELREFKPGFLEGVQERRAELLAALLTIWRWGRQNPGELRGGLSLGSYEEWCEWVRDPLLAFGCVDPVKIMLRAKQDDPDRMDRVKVLKAWLECHGSKPMKQVDLDAPVIAALNLAKDTPQAVRRGLEALENARAAGLVLIRKKSAKHSDAIYTLHETEDRATIVKGREAEARAEEPESVQSKTRPGFVYRFDDAAKRERNRRADLHDTMERSNH